MAKRILVIGNALIEFRVPTPYIPAPDEIIKSDGRYTLFPAGDGAVTAVALEKLDLAEADICARIGDDFYGERLRRVFVDLGVNTKPLITDEREQTGFTHVLIEGNSSRRTVLFEGANKNLCAADVDRAFTVYPDAVLLCLSAGVDAVSEAVTHSGRENKPLFVDCCGITKDFPIEKIKNVTCITPNETETELITGVRPDSIGNCLKASIALCSLTGASFAVLKLGSRGCFVYDGTYCDIISSRDVECVDKSGAGAVFTAALVGEYMRSGDMIAAAEFACAAAALTVSQNGIFASIPTRQQVLKLMNAE